jgi:hypothetical protein
MKKTYQSRVAPMQANPVSLFSTTSLKTNVFVVIVRNIMQHATTYQYAQDFSYSNKLVLQL